MGKQGPCGHCGIATTPLWRNGPPEKPVLCNACGSRWRTKGTLQNYMPMHSGGFGGSVSPEGSVVGRGRKTIHKSHSEPRPHKRKEPSGGHQERGPLRSHLPFLKTADDSISTSSLSSYVSGSEDGTLVISSPVQSDFTASSSPWEGRVPSRKRTSMVRSCTSVDKLIRQFQELLCEDSAGRSSLTSESPEDILVDSKPSIMADEIGLGSIFIRQPMVQEHRGVNSGEPNSMDILPSDLVTRQIGGPLTQLPNGAEYLTSIRGKEKAKQGKKLDGGGWMLDDRHISPKNALLNELVRRENFPYNKRDVLQSCQSPLVLLELKDIINFDTFTGLLTEQEQGQLLKFLSAEDAVNNSESLKEMFSSAQFEGWLANFQLLLSESMFEPSAVGVNAHVLQHFQQLQTLTDLTSSGWMEQCLQFHSRSRRRGGSADFTKSKELNKERLKGYSLPFTRSASPSHKQSPGRSSGQFGGGVHEDINSNMGVFKQGGGPTNFFSSFGVGMPGKAASEAVNLDTGSSSNDAGFGFDAGGSCYDGNSLLPTDRVCGIGSKDDLPDLHSPGSDETEADLLFNIPTHMMPFQDTDLLQQPVWAKSKKEVEANQVESGNLFGNIWHMDTSTPSELFWNPTCTSLNGASLNPGRLLT